MNDISNLKSHRVSSLYDSHVHWLMTGEKKSYFDLETYSRISEISPEQFTKNNFRGDWLFGFGWNDSQLSIENPYLQLDRLSTSFPICFIKKDAHSCILNSVALERVLKSIESNVSLVPFVDRSENGKPSGILKESAFYWIYSMVPHLSSEEIKNCLTEAQEYFLGKGFSCIRDMTCSQAQWSVLKEMQADNKLKVFADINFNADSLEQLQKILVPYLNSESKSLYRNLKIRGIKIFYDGSLGSKTALLLENYAGSSHSGHGLWSDEDLYQAMKITWENGFDFSVHTLGDKAVDKVVDVARQLYSEKIRGYLNLEHVELIDPNTITKMKSLFVRCHMQPSHWLSDKLFLNDRLNPVSKKKLFSWEALRKAKVALSFGSDSPIEEADVALTYKALLDAKENGIDAFKGDFFEFYTHPERSTKPDSPITSFEGLIPIRIES